MQPSNKNIIGKVCIEQLFVPGMLFINLVGYLFYLLLGNTLAPELYAEVAVVLSFTAIFFLFGISFQLVTAKYVANAPKALANKISNIAYRQALILGTLLAVAMYVYASKFAVLFNADSEVLFKIMAVGLPVYFLVYVNRGIQQATYQYKRLLASYFLEIFTRIVVTITLLNLQYVLVATSTVIALGVLASFLVGIALVSFKIKKVTKVTRFTEKASSSIYSFFMLVALYAATQLVANNTTILMAKHFLEAPNAGMYGFLVMLGKGVYFILGAAGVLLFLTVINNTTRGDISVYSTKGIMRTGLPVMLLTLCCFVVPVFVIKLVLGIDAIILSPLIIKFILVCVCYWFSALIAGYYLLQNNYVPVVLMLVAGILQMAFVGVMHANVTQIVNVQLVINTVLFVVQVFIFIKLSVSEKALSIGCLPFVYSKKQSN